MLMKHSVMPDIAESRCVHAILLLFVLFGPNIVHEGNVSYFCNAVGLPVTSSIFFLYYHSVFISNVLKHGKFGDCQSVIIFPMFEKHDFFKFYTCS